MHPHLHAPVAVPAMLVTYTRLDESYTDFHKARPPFHSATCMVYGCSLEAGNNSGGYNVVHSHHTSHFWWDSVNHDHDCPTTAAVLQLISMQSWFLIASNDHPHTQANTSSRMASPLCSPCPCIQAWTAEHYPFACEYSARCRAHSSGGRAKLTRCMGRLPVGSSAVRHLTL